MSSLSGKRVVKWINDPSVAEHLKRRGVIVATLPGPVEAQIWFNGEILRPIGDDKQSSCDYPAFPWENA